MKLILNLLLSRYWKFTWFEDRNRVFFTTVCVPDEPALSIRVSAGIIELRQNDTVHKFDNSDLYHALAATTREPALRALVHALTHDECR